MAVATNPGYLNQSLLVFRAKGEIFVAVVESRENATRIVTAQRRRNMRKKHGP